MHSPVLSNLLVSPSPPVTHSHHPLCRIPGNASFPLARREIGSNITNRLPLITHCGPVLCNAQDNLQQQQQGSSSWDSNEQQKQGEEEEEEEEYRVVSAVRSRYNDIVIVDTAKARMLLLDSTHNVHSILNKGDKWTGSYWDDFVSLPAIVPEGPIAIFGLGGGTVAHLMLDVWPHLQLQGWEIDDILIDKAREHFGLSDLEICTKAGGKLQVHIGDALSPAGDNPRKYAGIVIDLFSEGKVLAQLQEAATWLELDDKLMPNGRFMVNCGGIEGESDIINGRVHNKSVDAWVKNPTIEALSKVFPGQLSWKRTPESQGPNYLALTGPLPDLTSWSASVPDSLSESVRQWRPCALSPEEPL